MNVKANEELADDFSEYLFGAMRAYYDKSGLEEVPAGVVLGALIEVTGATMCVVPENRRAGAILAFIQDVIDETERVAEDDRRETFLAELRERLSGKSKPAEAA